MNFEDLNGMYWVRLIDDKGLTFDSKVMRFTDGKNAERVQFRAAQEPVRIEYALVGRIAHAWLGHDFAVREAPTFQSGALVIRIVVKPNMS
jgi:hypothetical protein